MSTRQLITALARDPQLSAFIAAVRATRLENTLKSLRSYTLVIPVNSAFAAFWRAQNVNLHGSGKSGRLLAIVKFGTIPMRISPRQFASGASPKTLQGKPLRLSTQGSAYKVNGATVLCGNIRTSGATVYVVDHVLLPPR